MKRDDLVHRPEVDLLVEGDLLTTAIGSDDPYPWYYLVLRKHPGSVTCLLLDGPRTPGLTGTAAVFQNETPTPVLIVRRV